MNRRTALCAGSIGLLGLSDLARACTGADATGAQPKRPRAKSCIFIFLSGGLSQHDSFDMKPHAADDIRGEFQPIATQTPGLHICEHLPRLAQRSPLWSLCRSVTHSSNEHSAGHHIMLTGRSDLPQGFNPSKPLASDHPSIASVATATTRARNNLPPAVVLPEKLVHNSGRVIPGQFAGSMGGSRDPWFIEASPFHNRAYGAYPDYTFDHQERGDADQRVFRAPNLSLPHWLTRPRLSQRLALLENLDQQRKGLDRLGETAGLDQSRQAATSLLTHPRVRWAFDVSTADPKVLDRYGRHSFGLSLLMARRLVEVGVNLIQVNLGNNETWDTHGNAFPHLKNNLFPPTDQAVSALLDDLHESGQLEDTLVVMAGEFGRTPKISHLVKHYQLPGRDHWGALQTVFFAGGGVQGGRVIGASDKLGAYPTRDVQRPENFAATIYHALGLPKTTAWYDDLQRPHFIYHGDPIPGLT